GPQCRSRKVVRCAAHHQGRRHGRQGDRARGPFENMGVQIVRKVVSNTSDQAGDGTTATTILAHATSPSPRPKKLSEAAIARQLKIGRTSICACWQGHDGGGGTLSVQFGTDSAMTPIWSTRMAFGSHRISTVKLLTLPVCCTEGN